jgi:hypothetical protein
MLSGRNDYPVLSDAEALEVILRLARRCDRKALKEFFSEGYSVGHRVNGMTAVEKLAMEGDVDAVNFLLDYFCASLNCAARGYARAGNVEQVETLLEIGVSKEFAIEGYAVAQLDDHVNDLIYRGAEIYYAIYGYAQVNAIEKMIKLDGLVMEKQNMTVEGVTIAELRYHYDNIEDAWHAGFAKAGNIKLLDALKGREDSVDYRRILVYAEAGLVDFVYGCIANATNKHIAIRRAVEGFAMGGHQEQVEQLLLTGTDIGDAIHGYAKSGMVRQAEELLKRSDDKVAAYLYLVAGLMKAGIVSKVDVYVQAGMRDLKWLLGLRENERESDFPGYRDAWDAGNMYTDDRICLKILSFTNTVKLREILVRKLEDLASDQDKDKYQVLAAKAREINRWMNEYDLGYSNALKIISLTESERVWCLQGRQMTRKRDENDVAAQSLPIIPYEIFLSITAKMLELSIKNAELVVAALHEGLMAGSIKRNVSKFEGGFFTRQQLTVENVKADAKFNPIVRFN